MTSVLPLVAVADSFDFKGLKKYKAEIIKGLEKKVQFFNRKQVLKRI
jgi:hypothetical protein